MYCNSKKFEISTSCTDIFLMVISFGSTILLLVTYIKLVLDQLISNLLYLHRSNNGLSFILTLLINELVVKELVCPS